MSALIFHIDVNSAFLSWEAARRLRDDPDAQDLRTIDAVIGGSEETRHGVVLAKSPSAKRCGIMTGEPLSHARQKCPHLTVVPPDHELYVTSSRQFIQILEEVVTSLQALTESSFLLHLYASRIMMRQSLTSLSHLRTAASRIHSVSIITFCPGS